VVHVKTEVTVAQPTPAYRLIQQELRRLIAEGKPGDPLPSDSELCLQFRVSRMTARQAVQRLAADGLLYRVPGSGTFVAQAPVHRRSNKLMSFTEEMRHKGRSTTSRLLEAGIRPGFEEEVLALRLPPSSGVIAIRRVRLADDVPMAMEYARLSAVCAGVLTADLTRSSLFDALRGIGRVPTRAEGTLTAEAARADEAALLNVPEGAPLLVERRIVFDQSEKPVEFTESRYVGGRYLFEVDLEAD
jgi:GntR family transcriptional regulator